MHPSLADNSPRQRAPSRRALATRARVLDAAERVFAQSGFDGATVRDIADAAGEPVGTVHHHGGGKARLFAQVVARRAGVLSQARLAALDASRTGRGDPLTRVVSAFVAPFFDLATNDPGWANYARLVAQVSADARWRDLAAEQFDPAARVFVEEILCCCPGMCRRDAAQGLVMSVAALLALLTSQPRVADLGDGAAPVDPLKSLIAFCAAGLAACHTGQQPVA